MNTDYSELRDIAARLARDAGTAAFEGRRAVVAIDTDTKSSPVDVVTKFDREAEALIVGWLQQHRPADAIVGEEGAAFDGTSGYEWHLDPIDGTTNFVYDQPAWCCSVAVRETAGAADFGSGRTVAGAVYVPVLDELFTAALGAGATLNGRPLRANPISDVSLALVGTGFSFSESRRREQGNELATLLESVRDLRRLGSAAIDLCFVACGRLDAYFETGLNSWDMAAGELVATEAGAISTNFSGAARTPDELLVSAPGVHRALVPLLS